MIKDHYKTLGISPSAGRDEIRKAYRRLAAQFHPDKNPDDPYAISRFHEIREAYETLSDPARKDKYLQQRWYNQAMNIRSVDEEVTPHLILTKALDLRKYASRLDVHRMDRQGFYEYLAQLLSDDNIDKLNKFDDVSANSALSSVILECIAPLNPDQLNKIVSQLYKLRLDEASLRHITSAVDKFQRNFRWERTRVWIILLATTLLCILLYLVSR